MSARKAPSGPHPNGIQAQTGPALGEMMRREDAKTQQVLEMWRATPKGDVCDECEPLLVESVFTAVRTSAALEERTKSARAGLIDNVELLHPDAEVMAV